jgi:hypothetical protein
LSATHKEVQQNKGVRDWEKEGSIPGGNGGEESGYGLDPKRNLSPSSNLLIDEQPISSYIAADPVINGDNTPTGNLDVKIYRPKDDSDALWVPAQTKTEESRAPRG